MTAVDVCVATYRRSQWLGELLVDLAAQDVLRPKPGMTPIAVRVIVVDNDPGESARAVVESHASAGLELVYLTQPQKNISLTRNRALDHSSAPWVAFVDDDERVPPHWLASLLRCQLEHQADVVFGPARGRLDSDVPAWVRAAGLFQPRDLPTGTRLRFGATNNALMRGEIVTAGWRFDPRYGLTGGEDTHLFHLLALAGRLLVWCREAEVSEHIPKSRATWRWLMRRSYRGGQTYADIVERPPGGWRRLRWIAKRSALALGLSLITVGMLPLGRRLSVKVAAAAARNLGQISTLFNFRFKEYE